jgi:hypothetical protein
MNGEKLKHTVGQHHHQGNRRHHKAIDADGKERHGDRDERACAEETRRERRQLPRPEFGDARWIQQQGDAESELHQRRYQDDRPDPVWQPHFHGVTSIGLRAFSARSAARA